MEKLNKIVESATETIETILKIFIKSPYFKDLINGEKKKLKNSSMI